MKEAIEVILFASGVIVAVGGATAVIVRWITPAIRFRERFNNMEREQCQVKEELKEVRAMSSLMCKGMLAILDHEVTGNSIDKLKSVKDELRNYLTEW